MPRFGRPFLPLASALLFGCGSGEKFDAAPPFTNEDHVRIWATSSSAVAVYSHAYELIGVADGALDFADASCPEATDDGTTLTVTGGCTDGADRDWVGRATVVRDGDDRTLTLDDFNGNHGTVVVRRVEPMLREFDAELVNGNVTAIRYSGSVAGDYVGPTTWNGSGRVTRSGVLAPTGTVQATTADEVVDDARCSGQPVSGSTSLHASGDTAVLTYDGANDCDSEQGARLVVNGDDRGVLAGINCSLDGVGARRASSGPAWALFVLVSLALLRRKKAY